MVRALDSFSLKGKNVVITGAGGNLCNTIVRWLASAGANLALLDIPQAEEKVKALQQDVERDYGITARTYLLQITVEEEVKAVAEQVKKEFGSIDGLVNAAGINKHGSIEEHTLADLEKIMDVNVGGTFCCTKYFGGYTRAQKAGSIVNIVSFSAQHCSPAPKFMPGYETSKGALFMMTRSVAAEYGHDNVRCNSVSPGLMESRMTGAKTYSEEVNNAFVMHTPLERKVKAEELCGAIIYFLSEASSGVTGTDLLVDCGYCTL